MTAASTDIRRDDAGYHLVFTAATQPYALGSHDLLQILDVPAATPLPLAPPHIRGVIDVQGANLPLVDLRILLGLPSLQQEIADLVRTLAARRQDHVNWLTKLKDAVSSNSEVTVQTDPHKCNFGIWYDRYESSSATFTTYLKRFDKPHQAIHRIAIEAKELMTRGRMDAARALVHETENTVLQGLLALFDGFEARLRRHTHEYAVVLRREGQAFALVVDNLVVFDIFAETARELPLSARSGQANFVTHVGRLAVGGAPQDVLILQPDLLHAAAFA